MRRSSSSSSGLPRKRDTRATPQLLSAAAAVFLLAAGSVRAQTVYVATNGDDAGAGSLSQPWLTVQHAANVAAPGNTRHVNATMRRLHESDCFSVRLICSPTATELTGFAVTRRPGVR